MRCYTDVVKVLGPYVASPSSTIAGRRYVVVTEDDGSQRTTLYSRWLMEQQLGRRLLRNELVDHIDEDFTNDSITNLQILTPGENIRKSRPPEVQLYHCTYCGGDIWRLARAMRVRFKIPGYAGPFCDRSCAARHQHQSNRCIPSDF